MWTIFSFLSSVPREAVWSQQYAEIKDYPTAFTFGFVVQLSCSWICLCSACFWKSGANGSKTVSSLSVLPWIILNLAPCLILTNYDDISCPWLRPIARSHVRFSNFESMAYGRFGGYYTVHDPANTCDWCSYIHQDPTKVCFGYRWLLVFLHYLYILQSHVDFNQISLYLHG